jgi:hypothetical protein
MRRPSSFLIVAGCADAYVAISGRPGSRIPARRFSTD